MLCCLALSTHFSRGHFSSAGLLSSCLVYREVKTKKHDQGFYLYASSISAFQSRAPGGGQWATEACLQNAFKWCVCLVIYLLESTYSLQLHCQQCSHFSSRLKVARDVDRCSTLLEVMSASQFAIMVWMMTMLCGVTQLGVSGITYQAFLGYSLPTV